MMDMNQDTEESSPDARTAPEHSRCDRHRNYRLTCGQFEAILARAARKCEICRTPSQETSWRMLHIDHDGPLWAVRGVLCGGCNSRLGSGKPFRPEAQEYLDNAWWVQQCAALGVPAGPRAEPPVGSAIINQFGSIWVRYDASLWHTPAQRHGPNFMGWDRLYGSYGPHNLAPYDLRAAYEDGTLPFGVRYAVENAASWGNVRAVLGVAGPQPRQKREWQPRESLPWLATPESVVKALRIFLTPDECIRIGELLTEDDQGGAA